MDTSKIPSFVSHVTKQLQNAGFEAYLVGGCVRDTIRGFAPKDWDITTNARPEQIIATFPDLKTVNENDFGTVTILNMPPEAEEAVMRETPDLSNQVQITTYRSEGSYSDVRRPDSVSYETDVTKDLERRDFTMNAIAWDPFGKPQDSAYKGHVIDPFGGIKDIKDKSIRCVLYPDVRFKEDALRMLRAVRFSTTLGFVVTHETFESIVTNADLLKHISGERIRDEFIKMIDSDAPAAGVDMLQKTGLLKHIIPELYEGIGCEQKGAHIYDVYDHLLHALQHAADKKFSTAIRLTALFHDIGKPATRRYDAKKDKYTFFGHEVVGARMTKRIMERLRFSRETTDLVVSLVRNHMFFSDTEQITLSAVRRIIQKVSVEHIWELMEVRECDRVGMKKAEAPYRLRKYHAMIEEALHDPISVAQLKIDGKYLMEVLHMKPSPRMGWILHALLEEVLEDPALNTLEALSERAQDLDELEDKDLKVLGEKGKREKEIAEEGEVKKLRDKHKVK
ncbi:MAG: HD domain-containing protein [Candidatus Pacebacteria bacterium]|jgi:putative nucleotidyltransferase with HDIG domain|nr:HD domain-containing protein [Candidatus Paceibacterota bacterium]MBP9701002.1 HD domain-containing protein [Candidatus Paceibacterota bacterium]